MATGRTGISAGHYLDVLLMTNTLGRGTVPRPDLPTDGKTLSGRHGQPEPRLPHEHDESSDSHPGTADKRIVQAARDLQDGKQDTGRTPVVTELASRDAPSRPANRPAPTDAVNSPGRGS